MKLDSSIWIIIPAYNEALAIADVLSSFDRSDYSVVVVDDASRDGTYEVCEKFDSLYLLRHLVNLGQGASLQTGIDFALSRGAKYLVTFDSDGQHTRESVDRLLAPLLAGECDITLGSRFLAGGEALNIPLSRLKLLRLATFFTRLTTGLKITDTHNGLRALTDVAAQKIKITQNRMAHASQLLTQIGKTGLRYMEVPVKIRYTDYSLQKGQKMSNAISILWESLTERLWR
ncbi:MAG TPA: glycosyltransferase family 2 protein [Oligoflexia bacterium]|nr:glycosyltransferase family 2 protein [Oligoflexia bacterium]HMP26624.1 glycosyltransferase family 2 protein [Oligoflexia bacterium]